MIEIPANERTSDEARPESEGNRTPRTGASKVFAKPRKFLAVGFDTNPWDCMWLRCGCAKDGNGIRAALRAQARPQEGCRASSSEYFDIQSIDIQSTDIQSSTIIEQEIVNLSILRNNDDIQ
jgi:hypothetical protein